MMKKTTKTKRKKRTEEEEEEDDDDDDGERRVAARKRRCRRSYPKTPSSQTSWPSGLFLVAYHHPHAQAEAWAALLARALEASRVPILGSVAQDVRTLYLASRRPRASAAPQPPVNSQPTLTRN